VNKPLLGDFWPYTQEATVSLDFMELMGYKEVKRFPDNVYARE